MSQSYCQHFEYLKISKNLTLDKEPSCRYCFHTHTYLWLCLAKNCGACVCSKNKMEHLHSHLEESRRNKKFHSVFINPYTTEIRCIQCNIEICDLDVPANAKVKNKTDPFHCRLKLLPGLQQLITHKIVGQLQNSQGHRKISTNLVGLFGSKYNYSINTAIQFISHISFFNSLLMQTKISPQNKFLLNLQQLLNQLFKATYRAVHSDTISQILYQQSPLLLGYQRKDPFQDIMNIIAKMNQEIMYYTVKQPQKHDQLDQWDLFYKKNMLTQHNIVYQATESTLSLNYTCLKCKKNVQSPHNIQFLKVNIPKKKRKVKEIEKELASYRYESPVKNRRKSLMNLFVEEECPITIPQLIIQLMKSPLHKQMNCDQCNVPLRRQKLHFQSLPNILIIQISRIARDGATLDSTQIQFSTAPLDMGPFTSTPEQQILYDFQTAVCIEKGCLFPVVVIGKYNKQKYVIRNENVQLLSNKQKMNPYILCYRRRPSESAKQKLTQIKDDIVQGKEKEYILPDFWYLQLQHGIERPLINQLVCKHNYLKPNTKSRMVKPVYVSSSVYEDLSHFYPAVTLSLPSPRKSSLQSEPSPIRLTLVSHTSYESRSEYLYQTQPCDLCLNEIDQLNQRRKKQKQFVLIYDKLKQQSLPLVMISSLWVKKWCNYLYNKESQSYLKYIPKGHPLPLSIDNKVLLQGNKCKNNLVKGEDFNIVNIYLWRFLKQLYGGGPQVRYKWKEGRDCLDQELINDIKYRATQLKVLYSGNMIDSPKKMMTSLSFIERSSSFMEQSYESPSKRGRMMIEEELEELEDLEDLEEVKEEKYT